MNTVDINLVLRSHLRYFIKRVASELIPDFTPNWHVDAICHQLERVRHGECRNLIITQPPRSLKSICASVAFPAWILGHDPRAKVICVSYGSDLGTPLSRQCRQVMNMPWYRSLFPATVLASETVSELHTTEGGFRLAATIEGALTGRGADFLIVDDPIKAADVYSESTRKRVNDWFGNTAASRLDDKKKGAFIVTMQRLHEDDPVGHLISREGADPVAKTFDEIIDLPATSGGWTHLNLPAIADAERFVPLPDSEFYCWAEDEPLQKKREPLDVLKELQAKMGTAYYSAQYLQSPMPAHGNIIKRRDVIHGSIPEDRKPGAYVVQSWDIALTEKETSDYSVCTTWLVNGNTYYLINVWRGKKEFPELAEKAIALWREYKPRWILIEKTGLGLPFLQDIVKKAPPQMPKPHGIKADLDKKQRLIACSPAFEAGHVILHNEAAWLAEYEAELLGFPNSRFDDQVDSTSQFLNWIRKSEDDDDSPSWIGIDGPHVTTVNRGPVSGYSEDPELIYDMNPNDPPTKPWP